MTPDELKAIKERCEAAKPVYQDAISSTWRQSEWGPPDQAVMAALRALEGAIDDIPALLAEVERLRKALEQITGLPAPIYGELTAWHIANAALQGDDDV